ncbi:MAG: hypothetical protein QGG36_06800 [Pirellulaceae bacterium]|nr:hypothetical protein [Pirellulaceae bacterium]MDP7015489.1 hypothetical protein [Pirellulaceae bacterium]
MYSSSGRIQKCTTRLKERWLETRTVWRDDNGRKFKEEHLDPLAPQLTLLLSAIQRMSGVIDKAVKELEDPEVADR